MYDMTIAELIAQAKEQRVRIEVELVPDEYGHVTQRITVEPFVPYMPLCPYHMEDDGR